MPFGGNISPSMTCWHESPFTAWPILTLAEICGSVWRNGAGAVEEAGEEQRKYVGVHFAENEVMCETHCDF